MEKIKRQDGFQIKFGDPTKKQSDFNSRLLDKKTHKEFTIDGITVVALNKENAINKVNKIKNNG